MTWRAYNDDLDNRARRNNGIFYGIPDEQKETWSESEEKVVFFCSEKLSDEIDPTRVERAHRIGSYTSTQQRIIIMKLLTFKDEQRMLAAGAELKENDFSIAEDYLHKIRFEQKQLFVFARKHGGDFKLRFNKLSMNNKTFIYDYATNAVNGLTE